MKINQFKLSRFGAWKDLTVEQVADHVTVFYGRNEAGKSTLMHFLRGILYGFQDERRSNYLPAPGGGAGGGELSFQSTGGNYTLQRRGFSDSGGNCPATLTAADGTQQGEHLLRTLLASVDEPTFNNVFAVGLREMQQLGTLSDTEAATFLYSLTSGVDRVSLFDVLRELNNSRNRLIASEDAHAKIPQLLARRDALRAEIDDLTGSTHRWTRLLAKREQLDRAVVRHERETTELEGRGKLVETAITIFPLWEQRKSIESQIAAEGGSASLAKATITAFDETIKKLAERTERYEQIRSERAEIREQAKQLRASDTIWRLTPRIEAVREQREWINTLEHQIETLDVEISRLRGEIKSTASSHDISLPGDSQEPTTISLQAINILRPIARRLRESKQQFESASSKVDGNQGATEEAEMQIAVALAKTGKSDLSEALEDAGNRVAQLRRRVQLDERIAQMEGSITDLEQQSFDTLDQQMIPVKYVLGLGGVFVFGAVLLCAKLIFGSVILGGMGWFFAIIGALGMVGSVTAKFLLERNAAKTHESCNAQLDLLARQLKQAHEERDALDLQLPKNGGPIASRLRSAEQQLAELEELVPLDSRRQAAAQEASLAKSTRAEAKREFQEVKRIWQQTLKTVGLPTHLSPKQISLLSKQSSQIEDILRKVKVREEERQQRKRELDAIGSRIRQLMEQLELEPRSKSLTIQIEQMTALAAKQEASQTERGRLKLRYRKLRKEEMKYERSIEKLKNHRTNLLNELGTTNELEVFELLEQFERTSSLRSEHEKLSRELELALGSISAEEIEPVVAATSITELEKRWEEIGSEIEKNRMAIKDAQQQRGELNEQLRRLVEDDRLADRQLELSIVENELENTLHRWQVLAATTLLLDSIRQEFEKHRQPQTLIEASGYLEQLTEGRYRRVWTPLGDATLYIEDEHGETWTADRLSRGTREQLFLSLRLALVALFSRRGITLPVVLDDVLVNFDTIRSQAAARVLCEFAAAGHQLLIFTCHEHVWQMFQSLHADARKLPDNSTAAVSRPDPNALIEALEPIVVPVAAEVEEAEEEEQWEEDEYEEEEYEYEEEDEEPEDEYEEEEYEEDEYEEEDEDLEDEAEDEEEEEYEYVYEDDEQPATAEALEDTAEDDVAAAETNPSEDRQDMDDIAAASRLDRSAPGEDAAPGADDEEQAASEPDHHANNKPRQTIRRPPQQHRDEDDDVADAA